MRHRAHRLILIGAIACLASQANTGGASLHDLAREQMAQVVNPPATQREDSLLVSARAHGGTAKVVIDVDGPISTVESMTEPSSLIMRGVVRSATTKLSPDETQVVTEYELVASRFYKGSLPALARPGATPPLRFTIPFGTLDIDGLHLYTGVNIFPAAEMPRSGDDIIVFLNERRWQTYELCCGAGAAFRVIDGQVVGLTKEARDGRHDGPRTIAEFEQRLTAALSKAGLPDH